MEEVVRPRGAGAVALRPCPPWCTLSRHFGEGEPVDADDGYHHCGPEIAVPTSYRAYRDEPETVVRAILKSWTHPLDAAPGPALIEVNLGTAAALTELAAAAERAGGTG